MHVSSHRPTPVLWYNPCYMEASNRRVDVILPTYNRRAFLPRAIGCILKQTFRDWRLLVVNDGGEDVADIVGGFGDGRIVYFNRPHAGKAAQLNFALGQVTAPYVAYMDDDDDVFPDHLEKLVSAAERVGADFVYSDTYLTFLDPEGKVVYRTVENEADAPYGEIRLFNRINHKQVLHTKELADRAGPYDESMRVLIDFDGIKRLVGAARHPFHLREVTGDHFLRGDPATGEYSSISGLWKRDPRAAGESLLSFFGKDPAALAELYQQAQAQKREILRLEQELARKPGARIRRLFGIRRPVVPIFHEVLPSAAIGWKEIPTGGLASFFGFADETEPSIAAVNRIAEGSGDRSDRKAMCRAMRMRGTPDGLLFSVDYVGDALRIRHASGTPHRWVMLQTRKPLPKDFALTFTYTPHTVFQEQLQVDFGMRSLGDRLRFMIRRNERLGFSCVNRGRFGADTLSIPFSFALGKPAEVRISSRGGVHSIAVDGKALLSVSAEEGSVCPGSGLALVFYESGRTAPIDFGLSDLKLEIPRSNDA